jgi:surfeit locus 1 family protein
MSDSPQFKFKISNTLFMLAGVAICLSLANWQMGRIEEKKQKQRDYESMQEAQPWNLNTLEVERLQTLSEHPWQPVSLEGEFLREYSFFLDSQVYKGKPGYNYIVPLKLKNNGLLALINLGWLSAGNDRSKVPAFPEINIEQPLRGHLAFPKAAMPGFEQTATDNKVKLFIDLSFLEKNIGGDFLPMLIKLDESMEGGLPREWPEYQAKVKMHKFYVIHWLVVAALCVVIYLYRGFKTERYRLLPTNTKKETALNE